MKSFPWLEKLPITSLYVAAGLLPLWFLPFTQDMINFPKQFLLVILVLATGAGWLYNTIVSKEISLRKSPIHVAVAVVVIAVIISAMFSLWVYGSFWGWPLHVSDNVLTIAFFALLYLLVGQVIGTEHDLAKLFLILGVSTAVAGLYAILQGYGIFIMPFAAAKTATFNTIGSVNSIAVALAVLVPLLLTLGFSAKSKFALASRFCLGAVFIILFLINFLTAWLVMIVGLVVLLVFGMWNVKQGMEFGWISLPMALVIVALFFVLFRGAFPWAPHFAIEVSPSLSTDLAIAKNVLQHSPAFGSGPGTFVYDYTNYHPQGINQTAFWATRFASGRSEIIDWVITKGLVGGLAFLSLIGVAIALAARKLLSAKSDGFSWLLTLGLLASFLAMVAVHVLYYSNFTISLIFWLLLAGLAALVAGVPKKITIQPSSFPAVACSFAFMLVVIFGIGFLFVDGQKYIAEAKYFAGINALSQGNYDKGIAGMAGAATLNPFSDLYPRDLSQVYISLANQIAASTNLSADVKKQQSQVAVANAIASANRAVIINPKNVENWTVRGYVYRNLIGIQDADALAIESYNKALELEPLSPFIYTELGRVYLAQAQILSAQKASADSVQAAIAKALDYLVKAIDLKSDYAPAHYLTALAYGQQGKSDQEIIKLENTKSIAPNDVGLAFQLGVLYYQKNQLAKAQAEFERARDLAPDYANARYMLGLVYDKQGQTQNAIAEFKKVLELNPGNEQVRKILENLAAGKPALTGLEVASPPIQENPPEINAKQK